MTNRPFAAILQQRLSRRGFLIGTSLLAAAPGRFATAASPPDGPVATRMPPAFQPVAPQRTDAIVLPPGYTHDIIARWGDSLFPDVPSLTGRELKNGALLEPGAAARQMRQFGAHCDAVAFFAQAAGRGDRGILCVNHEYLPPEAAFRQTREAGLARAEGRRVWMRRHPHAVELMKAAHGVSVIEVARRGSWRMLPGAPLTRRITAETVCEIMGPARGAALLRTSEDPSGTRVRGTFGNCAGGKTPWGTYLTAEENIDDYFGHVRTWAHATTTARVGGMSSLDAATLEAHRRFPLREQSFYGWEDVDARFDVRREPREALRFGWIVEIDPRNPQAPPRKRTALGRFSHEGAETTLARDHRVVTYMGDDDMFEYVYKFVTRRPYDPRNPDANRDLLDDGTLYVARFDADGTGEWLPLVYDERGPLNRQTGFSGQADVVIKARAAADLLGATPMDRPEDIQPSPASGHVYIACTNNKAREASSRGVDFAGRTLDGGANAANPRPRNDLGHIIELIEDAGDAAATRFRWNVFLLAGDPRAAGARYLTSYEDVTGGADADRRSERAGLSSHDVYYAGFPDRNAVSPIACPDNLGFDAFGRLWIVTDAGDELQANNGCFVCPTSGPERGALKQLMSGPVDAEICGCEFTPDGTTLFLSIQHPGDGGSFDEPTSHWPDGGDLPPRSTLIAVRREDGGPL